MCYAPEDAVLIGNLFYYNLTSRHFKYFLHCYTFTQLTISTLEYSHSVQNVLYSLGDCRPLTAWVAPVVFKITSLHGPDGKRSLYWWDVLEPFPSKGRGTNLQKTSYVMAILSAYWRADCYLATSNNIRNSIVACVYSVARCLSVRCLAIYITVLCMWCSRSTERSFSHFPKIFLLQNIRR
jgi:hypothetical protein